MASVFKSVTVAYRDADGHKCPKGAPGARKVRIKSKVWYGRYKDADGKRKAVPLCSDKGAAKELLAKLVTQAKEKQLYPDPADTLSPDEREYLEHGRRPLTEHVEDFRRYLLGKGNVPEYVRGTVHQVRAVLEGCQFTRIADMRESAVVEYLAGLREAAQPCVLQADRDSGRSTRPSRSAWRSCLCWPRGRSSSTAFSETRGSAANGSSWDWNCQELLTGSLANTASFAARKTTRNGSSIGSNQPESKRAPYRRKK
jgi:hypothetical protein